MLRGIDHLVVAVSDLDRARASYEALGFTVVVGGRHPRGTHNALISFADGAYIELIAFYEPYPEHKWWIPLERGGGLVDFCMQTDDLRGDTAAFRKAGVEIDDPAPLSRKRPDGYELRWVLSIPRGGHRGVAPFLIEDETPRGERVPPPRPHGNGVTGIETVTVAVDDVARVRGWYAAVLGDPGQDVTRADLDAAGARFVVGPHALEFLAPRRGTGALHDWLAARGPSPWSTTLTTAAGRTLALDEAKTFGARLTLT